MDYRLTTKQHQDRELFREVLADARNIAANVGRRPNLTSEQRDAVVLLLADAKRTAELFATEAAR